MPINLKTNGVPLKQPEHIHSFVVNIEDIAEERCRCGSIRVSPYEWRRRAEEWNAYYEMIKTTPAYNDFFEMREAFHSKNKKLIREILQRVAKRLKYNPDNDEVFEHDDSAYLPKPAFPDPLSSHVYVRS